MTIGVVGGGASAVCLLDTLAERKDMPRGHITVFEPSSHLWRGRPYQADLDVIRVNAPPGDMSVRAGSPNHFQNWLDSTGTRSGHYGRYWDPLAGMAFVPRGVYGDYLEQTARSAMTRLIDRGWRVELVRDRVLDAVPTAGGLTVTTERGHMSYVDYAVLCFGGNGPEDLYSLTGSNRYIADPYPAMRTMRDIPADATVGVIGSGLTAVDIVRVLARSGHRGRIRLLSRRGVLPSVRQRPIPHGLLHFTPVRFRAAAARGENTSLAELTGIMGAELTAAGENPDTVHAEITAVEREEPATRLRRQLAGVTSRRMGLRILQQAVPEAGPDVWPLLPDAEQDRVLDRHHRTMMSLCCPMSPASAQVLLGLIRSGQLELVRDLRDIEVKGDRFTVHTATGALRADYVINAVNCRLRSHPAGATPLIRSLVAADLAEPHPHGGVRVERATSRLTVRNRPDSRLHALGDPAAGSLFFTFGIQSLVDRSVDIVGSIRTDLASRASRLTNVRVLRRRYAEPVQLSA
ncbi:MAG TPA: FAD/NAD(P)-binding protein [Actinophytocola sp.]|uniref:FAD/NAD(P)-binding protein n=1 Tax=Actinophytocola sp. TaxID=1872138 RepID=UPI002DB7AFC9|nr:FAD/NAD(P)-binding protein [Actinophytocola sp.]HEU5473529.1 FAD/NAD(P)-binding protein [Actinophytocola sp.]